jgi:uncharacterized membrane protein
MEKRPRIKLELTTTDKVLEFFGWFSVVVTWGLTIVFYNNLPDIIPIHYNIAGEADGFGEKENILTLPVIATIFFVGLTILNRFPQIFNYPTDITTENALRQYTLATKMIRYLKLGLAVILGFITFETIQYANGQTEGLGMWFTPFMLGVIFIPLIYFIVKLIKEK